MKKFKIFLFFFFLVNCSNAFAEELIPIDAVLVLDVSRSMRTADPENVSRDAMNLFVDMLEEGRDRVGIVAYAGEVTRSVGITNVHSGLREIVLSLELASWTDHGVGLREAIEILAHDFCETRQGVVVFLTDGNMNVNPNGSRTNELAQEDVYAAIFAAREMNVPIHVIGLNFDGNLATDYLRLIARETGGLFFEVADAEEIPAIVQAFFHEMISAPQIFHEEIAPREIIFEEFILMPREPLEIIIHDNILYEESAAGINTFAAAAGSVLLLGAVAIFAAKKPKRVFTGILSLEIIDPKKPAQKPRRKNLIEFGSRVSLSTLLHSENPAFRHIIFTPSPTAPSHLPQLKISCKKNPPLQLYKDFLSQDISHDITINSGTEFTIETAEEQIRVRYFL
jgi:hypothetical protein